MCSIKKDKKFFLSMVFNVWMCNASFEAYSFKKVNIHSIYLKPS